VARGSSPLGSGTRRPKAHRGCGKEAFGYPAVSRVRDVLDRCVYGSQPNFSRTEIPPSPGSGYIRSHPFHRGLDLRGGGGEEERARLVESVRGPGKRQRAAHAPKGIRQRVGSEPQPESQPKAPAVLHRGQCLRFCAVTQIKSPQLFGRCLQQGRSLETAGGGLNYEQQTAAEVLSIGVLREPSGAGYLVGTR
jgi:hypothetical protein